MAGCDAAQDLPYPRCPNWKCLHERNRSESSNLGLRGRTQHSHLCTVATGPSEDRFVMHPASHARTPSSVKPTLLFRHPPSPTPHRQDSRRWLAERPVCSRDHPPIANALVTPLLSVCLAAAAAASCEEAALSLTRSLELVDLILHENPLPYGCHILRTLLCHCIRGNKLV